MIQVAVEHFVVELGWRFADGFEGTVDDGVAPWWAGFGDGGGEGG